MVVVPGLGLDQTGRVARQMNHLLLKAIVQGWYCCYGLSMFQQWKKSPCRQTEEKSDRQGRWNKGGVNAILITPCGSCLMYRVEGFVSGCDAGCDARWMSSENARALEGGKGKE